jgi:hypothetical protein
MGCCEGGSGESRAAPSVASEGGTPWWLCPEAGGVWLKMVSNSSSRCHLLISVGSLCELSVVSVTEPRDSRSKIQGLSELELFGQSKLLLSLHKQMRNPQLPAATALRVIHLVSNFPGHIAFPSPNISQIPLRRRRNTETQDGDTAGFTGASPAHYRHTKDAHVASHGADQVSPGCRLEKVSCALIFNPGSRWSHH